MLRWQIALLATALFGCTASPPEETGPAPPARAETGPRVASEPDPVSDPGPVAATLAPPPAPSEVGAPAEHLAPWPHGLGSDDAISIVAAIDDGPLVLLTQHRLLSVFGDGQTPTRALPRQAGLFTSTVREPGAIGYHAAGTVLLERTSGLSAFDARTLASRWRYRYPTDGGYWIMSSGDMFVRVDFQGLKLVGIDPRSGENRWERAGAWSPGFVSPRAPFLAARGRVIVHEGRQVIGLEARTGARRWVLDVSDDVQLIEPHEDKLAVLEGGRIVVVDLDDGSVVATHAFPLRPGPGASAALDGDRVHVIDYRRSEVEARVRSFRWREGRTDWVSEPFAIRAGSDPPFLRVSAGSVFVCNPGLGTRLLSSETGRLLWREASEGCAPALWRPRADAARVLFIQPFGGDALHAFARAAAAPPLRELTIEGTVRCAGRPLAGARVLLGDEAIAADRRGHFRATVRTARAVRVFAPSQGGCDARERVLETSGRADLALPETTYDPGLGL